VHVFCVYLSFVSFLKMNTKKKTFIKCSIADMDFDCLFIITFKFLAKKKSFSSFLLPIPLPKKNKWCDPHTNIYIIIFLWSRFNISKNDDWSRNQIFFPLIPFSCFLVPFRLSFRKKRRRKKEFKKIVSMLSVCFSILKFHAPSWLLTLRLELSQFHQP
jgi:hypothetical protein